MLYTNICSNIIVYQKYIGTFNKVDCGTRSLYASSAGPKAEGVPTNNQRGGDQGPVVSEEYRQGPCYNPNRLVSQSATLKE